MILIGCTGASQDAEKVTIELVYGEGESPFAHMMSMTRPVDSTRDSFWETIVEPVTGIPDTLLDPKVYAENIQIRQLVYQSFVSGKMDSAFYEGWTSNTDYDPSNYTAEYVDQQVHFVLAHDADSNQVLLFDTNNNEDFSDETAHTLLDQGPDAGWYEIISRIPSIKVQFDMYDGERVVTQASNMLVNPFMTLPNGRRAVLFGSLEYKTGALTHNGKRMPGGCQI